MAAKEFKPQPRHKLKKRPPPPPKMPAISQTNPNEPNKPIAPSCDFFSSRPLHFKPPAPRENQSVLAVIFAFLCWRLKRRPAESGFVFDNRP